MTKSTQDSDPDIRDSIANRHIRFGWAALLAYLTLGIVLEALNGYKVGWYLDVSNETRRTLLTLAHAHGVLFALVNIVLALTLKVFTDESRAWPRIASPMLIAATLLLPGGFLFGGLYIYDGDPGIGILLAPLGAVLFFGAVGLTVRSLWTSKDS